MHALPHSRKQANASRLYISNSIGETCSRTAAYTSFLLSAPIYQSLELEKQPGRCKTRETAEEPREIGLAAKTRTEDSSASRTPKICWSLQHSHHLRSQYQDWTWYPPAGSFPTSSPESPLQPSDPARPSKGNSIDRHVCSSGNGHRVAYDHSGLSIAGTAHKRVLRVVSCGSPVFHPW